MKTLLTLITGLTAAFTVAQTHSVAPCFDTLGRTDYIESDITIELPQGFIVTDSAPVILEIRPGYIPYSDEPDYMEGYIYPIVLESEAKDAVLMLPAISFDTPPALDYKVEDELKAAANNPQLNTFDNISVFTGKDMDKYCNADTAYIYNFELPVPYKGNYTHCTGIYLRKYGHPLALMKLIVNDRGLAKQNEYLNTLLNCVNYGDKISPRGREAECYLEQTREYIRQHGRQSIRTKNNNGNIN